LIGFLASDHHRPGNLGERWNERMIEKHTVAASASGVQRDFMLTFDDGPMPGRTDAVLDSLKGLCGDDGRPVRAGFFMVGDPPRAFWRARRYYAPYEMWGRKGSMRAYPELVARVQREGHWIGNHTARHIWPRWWWYRAEHRLREELQDWESIAADAAGFTFDRQPRLARTPYLADTPQWRRTTAGLGYRLIGGHSVGDASPDRTASAIARRAVRIMQRQQASPWPVVLIFHDIFPVTYRHLGEIVGMLQQQGYRLCHFRV
jgi:peptidoglycan/xylan/chitin deacetylase (PgdA/CDA1 family)